MSNQTLKLPSGRQLGYAIEGEGNPVIYFHGTASSRLEIILLRKFVQSNKIKLVGIDRPGYGLSAFKDRLELSDFASDVNNVADHLGINSFAILSWSGGGPFALAYTALFPERVTHTTTVGCPALPFDPAIAHNNNPLAKFAMKNSLLAKFALKQFRKTILRANQNINAYLKSGSGKNMLARWPETDARFFRDPTWLRLMYGAMAEGFKQNGSSVKAIYQEHTLFMKPWKEPLDQILPDRVTLWQGAKDKTCPPSNAQKLSQIIEGVNVEVFPDEGHCLIFAQPEKLASTLNQTNADKTLDQKGL